MPPSSPEPEEERSASARPNVLAGQHLPPPPRQERSRHKREALRQSALTLFAEQGYEQTSIEEIARGAGVAVGSFYQHFASKRQILLVLMDRFLQEVSLLTFEVKSVAPSDLREGIARLVRQTLQVDRTHAGAYHAWREATVRDGELRRLQQQIEAWTAHQLALLFRALLQIPGARPDVDGETLAWEFALLLFRLTENPLEDPDTVVASLTGLMYHGLFMDSQASSSKPG